MPPTNANPLAAQGQLDKVTTPQQQQQNQNQQQLRPPLYNAEDYASALRGLFTNTLSLPCNPPPPTSLILEHHTTHPPIIPGQGLIDMNVVSTHNNTKPEMSMKKFINGSELLFKLEADLRSAYPSFVQEFVSGDSDGVTCMLDALRTIHEALDHVNGLREQRKLVLDERSCVQCCALIMRNSESIPKLLTYAHGLYPIIHCTVSTNTSTRVLALEILTTVCEHGGEDAYAKVSEAISTLRLRLGEPTRCKVLVGAISSAAAGTFQATGIRFLRSFVQSAPSPKYKVYLQVELEEAGFNVEVLRKSAELSPARESRLVLQEIEEWDRVCVDVDTVVRQNSQLRNSVATLQQEIATLKDKIKKDPQQQQPQASSASSKYTKKRQNNNIQQAGPSPRVLSSTPIQTITTPVDSEEEAEQIHQILEDLNNIVNNEMLQHTQQQQQDHSSSSSNSEIVPVLNTQAARPPLQKYSRPVFSEPNLFDPQDKQQQFSSVKHVVQQLENSTTNVFSTTTLPNFNTGPLASKFANFKSSKLDTTQTTWNEESPTGARVKSLENLDNFTLKWKYPVVAHDLKQQQPASMLVLQDYRMNRFGGSSSSSPSNHSRSSPAAGIFSKNKKKTQTNHPQKTFQINLVQPDNNYNDLGSNAPSPSERVTDLPSGMY